MRAQPEETIEIGISRGLLERSNNRIKYLIQEKEYDMTPEEMIRAAAYVEMVEKYQYSPYNIAFEVPIPRRTPNDFADIVVFDETKSDNFIVVETKRLGCSDEVFSQAIEQGFGNANSLRACYLVVDAFDKRRAFNIKDYPPNERHNNIVHDLPVNYGLHPIYRLQRGGQYELRKISFSELASIFKKCHNILWSGGRLDPATAFDEMSKILFAKLHDERNTPNGQFYKFQIGQNENEVMVAQKCMDLYQEAFSEDPGIFSEPISVSDTKLKAVVEILQDISMSDTDLDVKGQAFEKFLGVVFRGELGQYFTRRQIVEFVVDLLEPDENDIVLDPSCGSGGFLLYSMKKATEKIKHDYDGNFSLIERKIIDFTRDKVYGIDINAKIARVAMMDMIVNDDGHTNIENNTGLNSVYENSNITFGKFTLIMTNPPFGVSIKNDDRDNLGQNNFNNFDLGKSRKTQLSDILFLEQYKNFLTNDSSKSPRLGVVLQTGVLNNPSNKKVLDWIKRNFKILAVVNLPIYAFRKAGSGMKTALLFLQKYHTPYKNINEVPNYKVFFAIANKIGYDSTLRQDYNELPMILDMYKNEYEDKDNGLFWLPFKELDYRLDPRYYYNKFEINKRLEHLKAKGHKIVPLNDLLSKLDSGNSPEGGVTRSTGEIVSVTVSNITKNGALDFSSYLYFVPDEFYYTFNQSRGGLEYLDILIAKDGATTGKTSIIEDNFPFLDEEMTPPEPKAIFSEHVFRLRVKDNINPYYLHAFLNSELGQLQLETVTSGGAQGGITRDFAKHIYVPLIDEITQNNVAELWVKKMNDISSLYNKYLKSIEDSKREVDVMIENSPAHQ